MNNVWIAFWAGTLLVTGWNVFYQDWIGKEAYLDQVTHSWVDVPPVIGLGVMLFAAWMLYHANTNENEEEDE